MKLVFFCLLFCASAFASWQDELVSKVQHANYPDWMLRQIEADLQPYVSGLSLEIMENTFHANYGCEPLLVHYQIHDQGVVVRCNQTVRTHNRCKMVTRALEELARCVRLPNVSFVVSLHDNFDEPIPSSCGPVFVFAKSSETGKHQILIPDFEALCGYEGVFEQVGQGILQYPWRKKKDKAFWRGVTTGGVYRLNNYREFPRYKLVALSKVYPEIVNAKLTNICQFEGAEVEKALEPFLGNYSSILEHMKYKYQVLVDGNTCTYSRAVWQLASNCVVFKQSSPNVQWYYGAIFPYVHYVPIQGDMSDLVEKVQWARKHDGEMFRIMQNANGFVRGNLQRSDVYLYLYLLLNHYASLVKN